MNVRYIYIAIILLMTSNTSFCQSDVFNYEVLNPQKGVYELSFDFYQAIDVQFIQIDLYEEDALMGSYEAIINKKQDNNYYLFFNKEERLVYMDDLKIVINNTYGKVNIGKQFIEVRLLDSDFKSIDTYRKEIR